MTDDDGQIDDGNWSKIKGAEICGKMLAAFVDNWTGATAKENTVVDKSMLGAWAGAPNDGPAIVGTIDLKLMKRSIGGAGSS